MLFCPSFTRSIRFLQTDQLVTRLQRVETTCCKVVPNFIRVIMGNVTVNVMETDAVFWWATIFCTYTPRKGSSQPPLSPPLPPPNSVHHPKNWSDVSVFLSSVPCIRSLKSAGQFIVDFVMGLMVGDRRFPGATILGRGSLLLPPTIPRQSLRLVQNFLMHLGVDSVRVGRSCTP